ncbi:MAG: hypothetical protein WA802_02410 [Terracidiphilus sp.]
MIDRERIRYRAAVETGLSEGMHATMKPGQVSLINRLGNKELGLKLGVDRDR